MATGTLARRSGLQGRVARRASALPIAHPARMGEWYAGREVPDPIEFFVSDRYLNRPRLYPRQATILKTIFLRDDLYTDYDLDVLDEWSQNFEQTGQNGISPDIFQRIGILKSQGWPHFHEIVAPIGRRGSKGHMGALASAYVLWRFLAKGDPQGFYGIDRDKRLTAAVYAGKKEQARDNQWRDLNAIVTGAPCFSEYIARPQAESLSVYAPHDFARMWEMAERGVEAGVDMASFIIEPLPSTEQAGRGPTGFCLDPDTLVLRSDLTWVPLRDIRAGDHVVGIDEQTKSGRQRRLREAEVLRVWGTRKSAVRLTFADGSSVVSSEDHRWLVRDRGRGGTRRWRITRNLTVGSHVCHLVDPWPVDGSRDAGYLAGIYDGEGCIVRSPTDRIRGSEVLFTQNTGLVLDRTLALLRERGFNPQPNNPSAYANDGCQQWSLRGVAETMRFLGQIRPDRLYESHRQVWEGLTPRGGTTPTGRERANSYKTIISIEHLDEQSLIDIETTSHTFVANGFISHNCQIFDEMAHVVATGANRSAEEVYDAAKPALDQFKKDGFIWEGSSPWQQTGKFYENYLRAQEVEHDQPLDPQMLVLQLTSWDPYVDYQRAHTIPLVPGESAKIRTFIPLQTAYQEPPQVDEQMRREEAANPETFAVERRAHFASVQDAYLRKDFIERMFRPWNGRVLRMPERGVLSLLYKGHGDPSKSQANFGFAIAHTEMGPDGNLHCIFDKIHVWKAEDFPVPDGMDHPIVDYTVIEDEIFEFAKAFLPSKVTFDQFNSASPVAHLNKRVRDNPEMFPKRVMFSERTATYSSNWEEAETFKTALGMDWVHAPYFDENGEVYRASELVELELRFLQEKNGKVIKQETGPVTTKDVADCLMEIVHHLIGEQVTTFLGQSLGKQQPRSALPGGAPLSPEIAAAEALLGSQNEHSSRLSGRGRSPSGGGSPARGGRLDRRSGVGLRRGLPRSRS